MGNTESVIKFEDVAVRYKVPREGVSGVKEFAIRKLERRIQYEEFWALKDVSFHVSPGEVFGIIGRNGAGKSTMLKVMARVLHPTRGRVVMRGRIAPLLELGGGFHPELTGRENVYLNMALLGFSRQQTQGLFDSIVAFSEIPEFIDAPLRTYSTGMVARLGFSVATCVRPEILLVDEVLSVGDTQFQQKCLSRMESFRQSGTTIVIVSHSLGTVQTFCNRVMWLNHGNIQAIGDAGEVIEQYIHQDSSKHDQAGFDQFPTVKTYTKLDPERQVYPVNRIFSPEEGTVTAWVRFDLNDSMGVAVLFHTDDSRFVLYTQALTDPETHQINYQITSRAGGNQRAPDPREGAFPEVCVPFFPHETGLGKWAHIAMTWEGYPNGQLRLYLDGRLVGERSYSSMYNDDRPLPKNLSVGMRPLIWPGERILQPDGTYLDLRPSSTHSINDAHIDLQKMHLYRKALDAQSIKLLYYEGH